MESTMTDVMEAGKNDTTMISGIDKLGWLVPKKKMINTISSISCSRKGSNETIQHD
ncbi:MAG: hypothetical protein H7069_00140 [Phormidesmis sp. FL-bin-119]|nr:hypothetical protein [Pedobacter sp.]